MNSVRSALLLSLAIHAGLLLGLPDRRAVTEIARDGASVLEVALVVPGRRDPTMRERAEPTPQAEERHDPASEPTAEIQDDARPRGPVPEPRPVREVSPTPTQQAAGPVAAPVVVEPDPRPPVVAEVILQPSGVLDADGAAQDYKSALQAEIARNKRYPRMARRLGQEGTVEVGFVILSDGRLSDVRVVRGSGHAPLDRAAVDALNRLGRFRPIPPELGRESWDLVVPMSYELL